MLIAELVPSHSAGGGTHRTYLFFLRREAGCMVSVRECYSSEVSRARRVWSRTAGRGGSDCACVSLDGERWMVVFVDKAWGGFFISSWFVEGKDNFHCPYASVALCRPPGCKYMCWNTPLPATRSFGVVNSAHQLDTDRGISDSMTWYRCGAMHWQAAPRTDGWVLATGPSRDGNNGVWNTRLAAGTLPSGPLHGMNTTMRYSIVSWSAET